MFDNTDNMRYNHIVTQGGGSWLFLNIRRLNSVRIPAARNGRLLHLQWLNAKIVIRWFNFTAFAPFAVFTTA